MGTLKDILEGITYAASAYLEVVDDMNNKTKGEKGEILLTHNGHTLSLKEWSKVTGIKQTTLFSRYNSGWRVREILETPVLRRNR